jgi:hypothetical protein
MCSTYNTSQMRHIFTEVSQGRGQHGGFLCAFADAVVRADPTNLVLLKSAMELLIVKYELGRYLDNYLETA